MKRITYSPTGLAFLTAATGILVLLAAPLSTTLRWTSSAAHRLHRRQEGLSPTVEGLLLAGGIALIIVAVLGILRPWAEDEARNLPSSGDDG